MAPSPEPALGRLKVSKGPGESDGNNSLARLGRGREGRAMLGKDESAAPSTISNPGA